MTGTRRGMSRGVSSAHQGVGVGGTKVTEPHLFVSRFACLKTTHSSKCSFCACRRRGKKRKGGNHSQGKTQSLQLSTMCADNARTYGTYLPTPAPTSTPTRLTHFLSCLSYRSTCARLDKVNHEKQQRITCTANGDESATAYPRPTPPPPRRPVTLQGSSYNHTPAP
jgi:hypothetical protein